MECEPGDLIAFEYELSALHGLLEEREALVRSVEGGVVEAKCHLPTRTVVYLLDDAAADGEQVEKRLPDGGSLGAFGPIVSFTVLD
jgi:hypothetical protein